MENTAITLPVTPAQRTMYHTQEFRGTQITAAIPTYRDDAWLGAGCYFWYDLEDAHAWGKSSKQKTGQYAVYESIIAVDKVLDTVFNEAHYLFWLNLIEQFADAFIESGRHATLSELNAFLKERSKLRHYYAGVMFQDLPNGAHTTKIAPIPNPSGRIRYFLYRKRIQLVVYDATIILSFTPKGDFPS